ncbi:hypothetical protein M422DRAFT_40926 [Sphaerobolus stellatus SS14]|nr:hypothetical protein M422DRAFT_40926 [Sphaerobolus stellatus SS14]
MIYQTKSNVREEIPTRDRSFSSFELDQRIDIPQWSSPPNRNRGMFPSKLQRSKPAMTGVMPFKSRESKWCDTIKFAEKRNGHDARSNTFNKITEKQSGRDSWQIAEKKIGRDGHDSNVAEKQRRSNATKASATPLNGAKKEGRRVTRQNAEKQNGRDGQVTLLRSKERRNAMKYTSKYDSEDVMPTNTAEKQSERDIPEWC